MQLWPIPTQEHFPIECLLVASMLSNLSGSFLIFSIVLNPTWAILAAAVYTYAVLQARNIRLPHNPLYVGLCVSYFSGLFYFNTAIWTLLLCFTINFCFCFFVFYIQLLYDLYDRIIGYEDLFGTFLYLAVKVFSLRIVWAFTHVTAEQVSPWLVGFTGLVLLVDALLFRRQFRLLKLRRVSRRPRN